MLNYLQQVFHVHINMSVCVSNCLSESSPRSSEQFSPFTLKLCSAELSEKEEVKADTEGGTAIDQAMLSDL